MTFILLYISLLLLITHVSKYITPSKTQVISGKSKEEVLSEVGNMQWGTFKPFLAEAIIAYLEPLQVRYYELLKDKSYLHSVLREGAMGANQVADETLGRSQRVMGFMTSDDIAESE